ALPRPGQPGDPPARRRPAGGHGLHRLAVDRRAAGSAVRADHRGRPEGEPPARHHHDRGGPELHGTPVTLAATAGTPRPGLRPSLLFGVSTAAHPIPKGQRTCATWSRSAWAGRPGVPTSWTTWTSSPRGGPVPPSWSRSAGSSTPTASRSRW